MRSTTIIGLIVVLCMSAGVLPAVQAYSTPDQQQKAIGQTPPRLSFVDGRVSFRRPGAQDWTQAQLNTPLAPGDRLYTGSPGNLEIQIGSRAFVRARANTQIGLVNQEPDFLQFEVKTGYASFDLRMLEPGRTVEVDTPDAALTIDHAGYYRIDVNGERTSFITRRGAQATVTLDDGESLAVAPGEEAVIVGTASSKVTFCRAPQLDEWDQWNYDRTDHLLKTLRARYVSPEIYGTGDLDAYGTWRIMPIFGPVWVPTAVPPGWVPYSTGAWVLDPYYGWTWVDTQPWGWAPYHYGRWVFVDGFWGWAPGPVVVRPAYAPALVAFFGGPGAGMAIDGGSVVGWVALGWGEPLVPWWGPRGFIHRPWWGGWGGPRVVNKVVIKKTTVVNVRNITDYRNAGAHDALMAVHKNHFGRGSIASARMARVDARDFRPIHAAPRINAKPASYKPKASRAIRSPEGSFKRPAVATRAPHTAADRDLKREPNIRQAKLSRTTRPVGEPKQQKVGPAQPRSSSGSSTIKRPMGDRAHRSAPPRPESPRQAERISKTLPPVTRRIPTQSGLKPQVAGPPTAVPQPQERRLAGESAVQLPANRVKGREKPSASLKNALKNAPQKRVGSGRP